MNHTRQNPDRLHHAPDNSAAALLLIDIINDLEFEGAEALLPYALKMTASLAAFKRRAKEQGIPVIYVNDNFGRWRSDFPKLVEYCSRREARGQEVVNQLRPEEDDYFVLKPKHSAFFQTNLEILLEYLGASTVILTGMAADICVLFSANDAYMRDLQIYIPSDCVASESEERTVTALCLWNVCSKLTFRLPLSWTFKVSARQRTQMKRLNNVVRLPIAVIPLIMGSGNANTESSAPAPHIRNREADF